MNRKEQESLFNSSRQFRLQSYGNIYQISNSQMPEPSRSVDELSTVVTGGDSEIKVNDLVLSVFKSPVKEVEELLASENNQKTGIDSEVNLAQSTLGTYTSIQASDELLIADDLATETTTFTTASVSPGRLSFFRRMQTPRQSHRPSPTHKAVDDTIDANANQYNYEAKKSLGIPHPYYPIALPIDQAFKAKYASHHRRSKSIQERIYTFLEHPCGYLCIIYHFSV
jgi:hypothetical protein